MSVLVADFKVTIVYFSLFINVTHLDYITSKYEQKIFVI